MATTMKICVFDKYLVSKLKEINSDVDLDVFPSYITGILEDEEPADHYGMLTDALQSFCVWIDYTKQ